MVIYQPAADLTDQLASIRAQCAELVIVNNGCEEPVRRSLQAGADIHWIDSPRNNLALAQNLGIQHARRAGFAYVLLLDQDSRPASDMVPRLMQVMHGHPDPARLGMVAPSVSERHSRRTHDYVTPWLHVGFRRQAIGREENLSGVLWVIASGSLIPLNTFDRVGLMDERYGIDYVDKEFCLRVVSRGLEILVTGSAQLDHAIGRCSDHQLAGLTITATNHPPARRHTIYRNRLRTIGRYGLTIPPFLLYECGSIAYDIFRILCVETEKKAKLTAVATGARAALLGEPAD